MVQLAKQEACIGRARTVSTEVKAAYICGVFAGGCHDPKVRPFAEKYFHHAETAAKIAFGNGCFNPIQVFQMERFYDLLIDKIEESKQGTSD